MVYLHQKEERKVKGLLKVSLNGEKGENSCLKNKSNQQTGVDRNWINPSGLPLIEHEFHMDSVC